MLAGRSVEIIDLTRSSITIEGIRVNRRKGSKDTKVQWSDRLVEAYRLAIDIARNCEIKSIYLLTNRTGRKLSADGVQSVMARLKKKMIEDGHGNIFWTLHDLKRKGISDAKDDRIGGHKPEKMRQR